MQVNWHVFLGLENSNIRIMALADDAADGNQTVLRWLVYDDDGDNTGVAALKNIHERVHLAGSERRHIF